MTTNKRLYDATDIPGAVLYALDNTGGTNAIPIICSATGMLLSGMNGYRSSDATYQPLRLDKATNSLQTIDYSHHEVHSGSFFFVKGQADVSEVTTDFQFKTPNTTSWCHTQWNISAEGEFTMSLYENSVCITGTSISIYNANRNSATTSGVLAYSSPTAVTTGTLVWQSIIGSGKSSTEERTTGYEFIGKQNTNYIFRFVKIAAGTLWLDWDFNWYEHADIY